MIKKVMASPHRLFARHVRKAMHSGLVSNPYRFESKGLQDEVLENALTQMRRLEENPAPHLDTAKVDRIFEACPGLLSGLKSAGRDKRTIRVLQRGEQDYAEAGYH